MRVLRCEANLGANPDLWGSIALALEQSRFFVLFASSAAAQSMWVNREVEHWLTVGDAARLLIVLTDGELAWDEKTGDFSLEVSSALLPALAGAFASESHEKKHDSRRPKRKTAFSPESQELDLSKLVILTTEHINVGTSMRLGQDIRSLLQ